VAYCKVDLPSQDLRGEGNESPGNRLSVQVMGYRSALLDR
jgi:hypothetical protein